METIVKYLGQACLKVTYNNISLVSDPWFSNSAMLNSWKQFPLPDKNVLDDASKAQYIYISHDHQDHFDFEYLSSLKEIKTIITPNFINSAYKKALSRLHHNIVLVDDEDIFEIDNGFSIQIFTEKPAYKTNSVCIVKTPDANILNANDCGLDTEMLNKIAMENIDIFTYSLNFNANAFPLCYIPRFETAELKNSLESLKEDMISKYKSALNILNPQICFPSAGPISLRHKYNSQINDYIDSTDWTNMINEIKKDCPSIKSLEINDSIKAVNRDFQFIKTQHPPLSKDIQYISEENDTCTILESDFNNLIEVIREFNKIKKIQTNLIFELTNTSDEAFNSSDFIQKFEIDTARAELKKSLDKGSNFLKIRICPSDLKSYLNTMVDFDTILLSQKALFSREPNTFDSYLHGLLKYGLDNSLRDEFLKSLKTHPDDQATFQYQFKGNNYNIPRHCPHENQVLSEDDIDSEGIITCKRHCWKFNIESGKCVRGDKSVNLYSTEEDV